LDFLPSPVRSSSEAYACLVYLYDEVVDICIVFLGPIIFVIGLSVYLEKAFT
jgi:hypothetical protein